MRIIVPIDFSPTSALALRQAVELAEAAGYGLHVVHVYDGFTNDGALIELKGRPESEIKARRKLNEFLRVNLVVPTPSHGRGEANLPDFRDSVILGDPGRIINDLSKAPDTALVIMGGVGSGVGPGRPVLFGSVARAVALGSHCPVWLVPKGYAPQPIDRAALAFDSVEDLRQIDHGFAAWRQHLDPAINFVHVVHDDEMLEARQQMDLLNHIMKADFPGYPVDLDLIPPGKLAQRLEEYLAERTIDLLVMGRSHRSAMERLFSAPSAKPMLSRITIPFLIIPLTTPAN
ncbi:universal stress protein [Lewinella sp. JB7]|uniref:universal stress protein n=1 Tax=Lewinella sp. JB7 TaxID=2962887 RepID=UPI0020C9D61D|nr:universal stress protein [Lewinella sp. JB7]MCP9234578.1 universal stress protein [Lewinella sp. JB7]